MPYVKTGATRHHLPSDPDFWVDLRARSRAGDRRVANEASTVRYLAKLNEIPPEDWHYVVDRTDDGERGLVIKKNMGEYNRVLLARRIVAWNLTDADGQPLEITPEGIDELDEIDEDFLLAKLNEERPKDEEGPFVEPSRPSVEESQPSTPTP